MFSSALPVNFLRASSHFFFVVVVVFVDVYDGKMLELSHPSSYFCVSFPMGIQVFLGRKRRGKILRKQMSPRFITFNFEFRIVYLIVDMICRVWFTKITVEKRNLLSLIAFFCTTLFCISREPNFLELESVILWLIATSNKEGRFKKLCALVYRVAYIEL